MKIIDISRELFSTPVYPGDPAPRAERLRRLEQGDSCNLSAFYTGSHSATHLDAPLHFLEDGRTIDQIPLERFFGPCTVVEAQGIVTGEDIDRIAPRCRKMLLLKGNGQAFLSQRAAFAMAAAGFTLVGTDAQSIAPYGDESAPHQELLHGGLVILEGLDLSGAEPGEYTLAAFPLYVRGLEAALTRAVLFSREEEQKAAGLW